jgi:Vacuolar protein sorting-associated protein 26
LHFERGNNVRFLSVVRELESAGQLDKGKTYPFEFTTEKPYETYSGINVRLRYFVRVTITRSYGNNVVKEQDFAIENALSAAAVSDSNLKVTVIFDHNLRSHIHLLYFSLSLIDTVDLSPHFNCLFT